MKASWVGAVELGVLSIKVKLYRAWKPKLRFRLLCKQHRKRVKLRKYCEEGEELSKEQIVRGVKIDGAYVVVEDALMEVLKPTARKKIEVKKLHEGKPSPLYIKESFFVAPDGSERQLGALIEALGEKHIEGTIIYRERVEPIALYVESGKLVASILHYRENLNEIEVELEKRKEDVAIVEEMLNKLEKESGESEENDPLYAKVKKYIEAKKKA